MKARTSFAKSIYKFIININELKEKIYKYVRNIHVKRFPYNNFLYPEID